MGLSVTANANADVAFVPEFYFSTFTLESRPTMHRARDVFAEVRRYFCENSVVGSKSRVRIAAKATIAFTSLAFAPCGSQ